MKRILLVLCLVFLTAMPALAERSETKTADALIDTGQGVITGMMVVTDGTNDVTVDIYNNTSATGTKLIPTWTVTTSTSNRYATISFGENGEDYSTGLYVDITCLGTVSYMVYYDEK